MGRRGPEKEYDRTLKVSVTRSQDEFLRSLSRLLEVSRQEVVRRMIDEAFVYSLAATKEKEK